jgi:hypothetical protein
MGPPLSAMSVREPRTRTKITNYADTPAAGPTGTLPRDSCPSTSHRNLSAYLCCRGAGYGERPDRDPSRGVPPGRGYRPVTTERRAHPRRAADAREHLPLLRVRRDTATGRHHHSRHHDGRRYRAVQPRGCGDGGCETRSPGGGCTQPRCDGGVRRRARAPGWGLCPHHGDGGVRSFGLPGGGGGVRGFSRPGAGRGVRGSGPPSADGGVRPVAAIPCSDRAPA